MRRLIWIAIAVALAAVGLYSATRPGVVPGLRADIDPAPFTNPAKDAQPVTDVVKPKATAPTPAVRKPNLVVILADDLGYGDLQSYGTRAIRTPNLDRLAAEGVRFTQFYSSGNVCSPSRAGLMTGRYPVRTGISFVIFANDPPLAQRIAVSLARIGTRIGTAKFHDSYVGGLPDSEITIAEALRVAGYRTGMVGKWHLGDFSHDRRYLPTRHGFDFFEGIPHSNDEFPVSYWRNDHEISANIGLDQEGVTANFTSAAVKFIDDNRDHPFFLYFAHKDVHIPYFPSAKFKGKSAAGPYGDAVEELDWSVGEILRALETRGLRDNTLVVFTSDNGPWYNGSTDGLRGRKGMPFEGGQRVPLLASWPGHVPAGTRVDTPAMNIDIFPTLLDAAGLQLPADRVIDGRDLMGVLSGTSAADPHDALLFFDDKVIDGVRFGPWKYYRNVDRYYWPIPLDKPDKLIGRRAAAYAYTDPKTGRTTSLMADVPMLYDLRVDPAESYNVADRHAPEDRRARAFIEAWEQAYFANPRGWK